MILEPMNALTRKVHMASTSPRALSAIGTTSFLCAPLAARFLAGGLPTMLDPEPILSAGSSSPGPRALLRGEHLGVRDARQRTVQRFGASAGPRLPASRRTA